MRHLEGDARIIISLGVIAGAIGGLGIAARQARGGVLAGTESTATPLATGTPNPVDLYIQAIETDLAIQRDAFATAGANSEDLSGQGLAPCVVNSDCLVGQQVCVAGPKPNTPAEPGYCVPR